jgi:hypothetical protein
VYEVDQNAKRQKKKCEAHHSSCLEYGKLHTHTEKEKEKCIYSNDNSNNKRQMYN